MDKNNLDKIFTTNEKQYQLPNNQIDRYERFKKDIYARPYHIEQAQNRNVTPEQLAEDFRIGVVFEGAARSYLKNELGIKGLNPVDLSIRSEFERGGHNYDLSNGSVHFNCKTFNYDRQNGKIPESFLFQKTSLKHEYPDNEYICCGYVSNNIVTIRAVVRMSVVRGLLLAPKSLALKETKKALYTFRLLDPELGLTEAA